MSQGLAEGFQAAPMRHGASGCAHFSFTVGTTEMPSGSGRSGSRPLSMTILTGTRCTILTKLPVAFSGGKAVNFEPEPSWMLSTWPLQVEARIGVDRDL